jgi:peptide deformylase
MALLEIRTYPDEVLRKKAEPVEKVTAEIRELAQNMAQTMYAAPGIGLAAPQIGESVRMIVIDILGGEEGGELHTLLNPEIVESTGESIGEEGCLSVPDVREEITRAQYVTVKAHDLDGNTVTLRAEDMLAVCLQHEIDHLNGVLFIDHLSRLKQTLLKKKLKKAAKEAASD